MHAPDSPAFPVTDVRKRLQWAAPVASTDFSVIDPPTDRTRPTAVKCAAALVAHYWKF
jgi:hypothetical protein